MTDINVVKDAYGLSDVDYAQLEVMEAEERCDQIVFEINTIRRHTAGTMLMASVEIGRLLIEAKDKLPYGDFGKWLKDNFQYSQSTANNLMKLYRNYGDSEQLDLFCSENRSEIFGDITPSQALALLPLPESERKEFVESHDMDKTTVKDIEAEIRLRQLAEVERDALKSQLDELKASQKDKLKEKEKKLKEKLEREFSDRSKDISERLKASEAEVLSLKSGLDDHDAELRKAIEDEYNTRIEEAEARAFAAEEKVDLAGNPLVQKFAVHYELLQREFITLTDLLSQINISDNELALKLWGGLDNLVSKFSEVPF